MYYIIEETLKETEQTRLLDRSAQFVAVLTPAEWNKSREGFDMGIDLEPDLFHSGPQKPFRRRFEFCLCSG